MATVSENIAAIQTQAAALDTLIASFLTAKATIEAAELEIRKAQPGANHEAHAGRISLATYAHSLMLDPNLNSSKSVVALASSAWAGVS